MSSKKIIDLRGRRPQVSPRSAVARAAGSSASRVSPVRTRRRRARIVALAGIVVVSAAAALGLHYVSYLPRLAVNAVEVNGARRLPPKMVAAFIHSQIDDGSYHFFSRANMFLYPKSVIENAVAGFFPRVKTVRISRSSLLAQAVTVTLEERTPYAKWCVSPDAAAGATTTADAGGDCYLMDDGGFIYANASDASDVPQTGAVFSGGLSGGGDTAQPIGKTFAPGHFPGLIALLKYLDGARFQPVGVSVVSEQDFTVQLGGGYYIKASYGAAPDALVRNLQLVLSSESLRGKEDMLAYVDLRFGNRVYYKLKGGVQEENN